MACTSSSSTLPTASSASCLIVLLAPVIAAAGVATLLSLGRPILFRQRRVGRDGVEFDMLKFRTMRLAEQPQEAIMASETALLQAVSKERTAARASAASCAARRSTSCHSCSTSSAGDMSLVGPRPERPEYAAVFDSSVYRYADRQRVKSGITGWAQVNGLRGQTSIADRAEWDNYYIENFSLWLDLKILLLTVAAVLRLTSD